jgi:hypothetical protein
MLKQVAKNKYEFKEISIELFFTNHNYLTIEIRNNIYNACTINYSPTGNCQIMSFSEFRAFLNYGISLQDLIAILQKLDCCKNQILIDIPEEHLENTKKYFKDAHIRFSQHYDNTKTYTDMVMMLIDITDLT